MCGTSLKSLTNWQTSGGRYDLLITSAGYGEGMRIQNSQPAHPRREHWEVNQLTGKGNFQTNKDIVDTRDLLNLSERIPTGGAGAFYHFQAPGVRPTPTRTAINAALSVATATALGAAGGVMMAVGTDLLRVATFGMVESMTSPLVVGGGLGLAVGVAATAYLMVAEKREYERSGEYVYGTLRNDEGGLAFHPYAQNSPPVNLAEYAQTQETATTPWWTTAHKNKY